MKVTEETVIGNPKPDKGKRVSQKNRKNNGYVVMKKKELRVKHQTGKDDNFARKDVNKKRKKQKTWTKGDRQRQRLTEDEDAQHDEDETEDEADEHDEDKEGRTDKNKKTSKQSKQSKQSKHLLEEKLKLIELRCDGDAWLEKLDTITNVEIDKKQIKLLGNNQEREDEFLKMTEAAVVEALKKLQQRNLPFNRPYDFLADMLKSDIHMEKVRNRILIDHEKTELREKMKLKKINKKLQKNSGYKRIQDQKAAITKKKNLEKIDKLKKDNKIEQLNLNDFFATNSRSAYSNGTKKHGGKRGSKRHIRPRK